MDVIILIIPRMLDYNIYTFMHLTNIYWAPT